MVYDWNEGIPGSLEAAMSRLHCGTGHNLCAAVVHALQQDFASCGDCAPRMVIFTDGEAECTFQQIADQLGLRKSERDLRVDVIAMGMRAAALDSYRYLALNTGGVFINIEKPTELSSSLGEYRTVLSATQRQEMKIGRAHV